MLVRLLDLWTQDCRKRIFRVKVNICGSVYKIKHNLDTCVIGKLHSIGVQMCVQGPDVRATLMVCFPGWSGCEMGRPEAPPGVLSLPSPSLYLFEKLFPGLLSVRIWSGISFLPIKPRQNLVLAKKKSKSFLQVLEGKLFTWGSKTRGEKLCNLH